LAQSDEEGFIKKAEEYTERYATLEYHRSVLKKWHEFYPKFPDVYDTGVALGRASSIDKRLPQTTLQGEQAVEDELQAVDHPSVSTATCNAQCAMRNVVYTDHEPNARCLCVCVCDSTNAERTFLTDRLPLARTHIPARTDASGGR